MSGVALLLLMGLLGVAAVAMGVWVFLSLSREGAVDIPGADSTPGAGQALRLGAALWLRGGRWDPDAFEEIRSRLRAAWISGERWRLVEYDGIHEDAVRAAQLLALAAYQGQLPPEQAAAWLSELGSLLYGDPSGRHLWERAGEEPPARSSRHPQGPA